MTDTLQVGNVAIVALLDVAAPFPIPLPTLWPTVPQAAWEPYRERYPQMFVDAETLHEYVACYLLRSDGHTLLIDTGLGPLGLGRRGALLDELQRAGVQPADVDTVFLTHLHADHVGWNLPPEGTPTFPRARYLVHQAEWEARAQHDTHAQTLGFAPFIDRTVAPLADLGILDLLPGERTLTSEVVALPTPGHSPGHMSLLISSDRERALITGDALIHPAQVTEPPWSSVLDMNGSAATATREQLLSRLDDAGLTMAGCHFPSPGYGRVLWVSGQRFWQAR